MSELYKYPVAFTKTSLNGNGELIVTFPTALKITTLLHAVIKYDASLGFPTQPVGVTVTSTSPFMATINCSECPDGNHVLYLIYLQ